LEYRFNPFNFVLRLPHATRGSVLALSGSPRSFFLFAGHPGGGLPSGNPHALLSAVSHVSALCAFYTGRLFSFFLVILLTIFKGYSAGRMTYGAHGGPFSSCSWFFPPLELEVHGPFVLLGPLDVAGSVEPPPFLSNSRPLYCHQLDCPVDAGPSTVDVRASVPKNLWETSSASAFLRTLCLR